MLVPEASVHKDDGAVLCESKVRPSGKSPVMEPVAQAEAEERAPDEEFGRGESGIGIERWLAEAKPSALVLSVRARIRIRKRGAFRVS